MQFDLSTIQTGTLLLAAATFFGAMVGSLTQAILSWRAKRRQKRNLRLALKAEISEMVFFELDVEEILRREPPPELIPTDVYESHIDEIGALTDEEVHHIVRLYSAAHATKNLIENPEGRKEWLDEFRHMLKGTTEDRENALDAIEDRL